MTGAEKPRSKETTGDEVPRDRGFRGMTVFQGRSDKRPALYVSTISNWGSLLLRSEDGSKLRLKPGFAWQRVVFRN